MGFEAYIKDPTIQKALDVLHWQEPTPVQERILPLFDAHQHILLQAQTGSGKTGAYALPILDRIYWEENKPQCLILAPTRELAQQIKEECEHLGKYKRIKCVSLIGKQPMSFQIQDIKQKCHVVCGTPGRVWEHIEQGTRDPSALSYLVLDEADEMCQMGFKQNLCKILDRLPKEARYCMCSATIREELLQICDRYFHHYETIRIHEELTPKQLYFEAYVLKSADKDAFLWKLLLHEACASALIFCNTRAKCESLYHMLKQKMECVDRYHGALDQDMRTNIWNRFRYGETQVLIASDIAARGLDMEQIDVIIHYELPSETERFIHRSGRSGRNQCTGHVISLINDDEYAQMEVIAHDTQIPIHHCDPQVIWNQAEDEATYTNFKHQQKQRTRKGNIFQSDILRLYIHGGKQKKIRAGDIVGAITQIARVSGNDIGVIQIQDHGSYVEILHDKGKYVYEQLQHLTIKNHHLKVEISHHQL